MAARKHSAISQRLAGLQPPKLENQIPRLTFAN
jgi:hypothetical protein